MIMKVAEQLAGSAVMMTAWFLDAPLYYSSLPHTGFALIWVLMNRVVTLDRGQD